jgi:hypothetical protein
MTAKTAPRKPRPPRKGTCAWKHCSEQRVASYAFCIDHLDLTVKAGQTIPHGSPPLPTHPITPDVRLAGNPNPEVGSKPGLIARLLRHG